MEADEVEPTLAAMSAAAGAVRRLNHAAYHAPASPESLYSRSGVLVEIMAGLRQTAFSLGNHIERAPTYARDDGLVLGSDNATPASVYLQKARSALADVAALITEATSKADQASSALSHLKVDEL